LRHWIGLRAVAFGAALQAVWHRQSVRSQLLIIVIAIEAAAALVAGGVTILQARTATRVEIEASIKLAQLYVADALRLVPDNASAQDVLESLPLQPRFLRHVRISVRDAADVPVLPSGATADPYISSKSDRAVAPAWFQALIAPPIERHLIPVTANGKTIGSVVIVSEPSDEIAEAWGNTVALAWVALAVNASVIAALYVLFGRALAPLTALVRGLTELEHRNYTVRLALPKPREFIALATRFNALAQALQTTRAENTRLGHRLITAQDDERRRTALELHDEVGPSLFGLKATATSIESIAGDPDNPKGRLVADRVHDMLAIIDHLQTINRGLLNRLRPMALGHVPVQDLIAQLVRDRAREHPQISFALTVGRIAKTYDDTIDLTIYRCIQESMTNAIRHAQPNNVTVQIGERTSGSEFGGAVELSVEDDGCGIAAGAPRGFGLSGMQERVQALGGEFAAVPRRGGGTAVRVAIPLDARNGGRDHLGPAGVS
jgi:two-component system sensor histidine kinase UhpB